LTLNAALLDRSVDGGAGDAEFFGGFGYGVMVLPLWGIHQRGRISERLCHREALSAGESRAILGGQRIGKNTK